MERLRRKTGFSESHEDHWKSFTDVFATVCLMFFFVLVVFGILTAYVGNEANRLAAETQEQRDELEIQRLALADLMDQFSDVDQQRALLEAEKKAQEEEIEVLWNQFIALQEMQINNMQLAQADFEGIANQRAEMYIKIADQLNEVPGVTAYYDEEERRLDISSDILFDKGASVLKPEYVSTVVQMGDVLFDIIDEYTAADMESLVRLEYIEIVGHTDLDSSGPSNRELSSNRAASFINQILPDGSSQEERYAGYFKAAGMSEFEPKEGSLSSQNPNQMTANRRVEIRIVFDDRDIESAIFDIAETLTMTGDDVITGEDGGEEQ